MITQAKKITYSLPKPDQYGNYYLGRISDPVIFPVKGFDNPFCGKKYFLSLGERGIVWDGGDFRYFDSPAAALNYLNGLSGA